MPGFSLSHSGPWITCALSLQAAPGIDIELKKPRRDFAPMSEAAFLVEEAAWLARQPPDQQPAAFYQLWSGKEALFKLGAHVEPPPSLISPSGERRMAGEHWHLTALDHPACAWVLATRTPTPQVTLHTLSNFGPDDWRCSPTADFPF